MMRLTFDAGKNDKNLAVHGVALTQAEKLEWDALIAIADTRKDYGEDRFVGYAPIGNRLFCVVFVDRADGRRIISLRKANEREAARYEDQSQN